MGASVASSIVPFRGSVRSRSLAIAAIGAAVAVVAFATSAASSTTQHWVRAEGGTLAESGAGLSCDEPGYRTIGAAVAAASDGDTINVCSGTYTENVAVSKALIIDGAGDDASTTTVAGSIVVSASGTQSAPVLIQDLTVTNPVGSGVDINAAVANVRLHRMALTGNAGDGIRLLGAAGTPTSNIVLDDVDITANTSTGIAMRASANVVGLTIRDSLVADNLSVGLSYNSSGTSILLDDLLIQDSEFRNNSDSPETATSNTGTGDISLFRFDGDATLRRVVVSTPDDGRPADSGVQVRGKPTPGPAGTVVLEDVTITGHYVRTTPASAGWAGFGLVIADYTDVSSISMNRVSVDLTHGNALFVFGLGNELDLGDTSLRARNSTRASILVGTAGGANNVASNVDATGASIGGPDFVAKSTSSASLAERFAMADRIVDRVDTASTDAARMGLVRLVANEVHVTAASGSIQRGIDAASSGDTVHVQGGSYSGALSITKAVALKGPFATTSPVKDDGSADLAWSGTAATIVGGTSGSVISMTGAADGASIEGFAITSSLSETPSTYGPIGINSQGPDDVTIKNNHFYGLYGTALYNTSGTGNRWVISQNLITNPNPFGFGAPSYYASETSGINPWYLNDLTVSGNRIDGYGRGIQLETNSGAVVSDNNVSNVTYHAIQAANEQTGTVIRDNVIDRAQLAAVWAAQPWPDGGVDWCTGAIRVWTVASSIGFVVEDNVITNTGGDTPGWCPAIAATGSANPGSVASMVGNVIAGTPGIGVSWSATQVLSARLTNNIATVSTTGGNPLSVGDTVTVSRLGPPFDGTWTVASKPSGSTFTFARTAPDVAVFRPLAIDGATAVEAGYATLPAGGNWWGSAAGPGAPGAAISAGGTSIVVAPWCSDASCETLITPALSGFTPGAGKAGDTVTVSGTALSGTQSVTFGTVAATSFTVVDDSTVTAVVPNGGSGAITVGLRYSSLTSAEEFTASSVLWVNNDEAVTTVGNGGTSCAAPGYTTLGAAITAASAGDTIEVCAGTYTETVTINKALDIRGANYGVDPNTGSRVVESVVSGTFSLRSSDISVNGFEVTGAGAAFAAGGAGPWSRVSLTHNRMVANTGQQTVAYGFGVGTVSTAVGATDWTISNNRIEDVRANDATAIALFDITDLTVSDNVILHTTPTSARRRGLNLDGNQDVVFSGNVVDMGLTAPAWVNTDQAGIGGGAPDAWDAARYALQLSATNRGTTNVTIDANTLKGAAEGIVTLANGVFSDIAITNNVMTDVVRGIRFQGGITAPVGEHTSITVRNNAFSSDWTTILLPQGITSGGTGDPYDDIEITRNSLLRASVGAALEVEATAILVDDTVAASCNWYGSADSASARVSGRFTFSPWLISGADTDPAIGFQPNLGACVHGVVSSVSPSSAAPGTTVTITGIGFKTHGAQVSEVRFGDAVSTSVNVVSDTLLYAVVPGAAAGGPTTITLDLNGGTASSSTPIEVVVPLGLLKIDSFSPLAAAPGSVIRVNGAGFDRLTTVVISGIPATFTVLGPTSAVVTVPLGAATNGPVTFTTAVDLVVSTTPLTVVVPTVSSLSTGTAQAGEELVISGSNLLGATRVTFGGGKVVSVTPSMLNGSGTQLTVTVPSGAETGAVVVTNRLGNAVNQPSLTVTVPLAITQPRTIPEVGWGERLTLSGTRLDEVTEVTVTRVTTRDGDGQPLTQDAPVAAVFTSGSGGTSLTITLPSGIPAGAQNVTVRADGTTVATILIDVRAPTDPAPTISSITRPRGAVGATVRVNGTGYFNVIRVEFSAAGVDQWVPVTVLNVVGPTSIAVQVPPGAVTGPVRVTTFGGTATSSFNFTVLP